MTAPARAQPAHRRRGAAPVRTGLRRAAASALQELPLPGDAPLQDDEACRTRSTSSAAPTATASPRCSATPATRPRTPPARARRAARRAELAPAAAPMKMVFKDVSAASCAARSRIPSRTATLDRAVRGPHGRGQARALGLGAGRQSAAGDAGASRGDDRRQALGVGGRALSVLIGDRRRRWLPGSPRA